MSVKKQIPSLCKLHSIYEEIPEVFLDKTDVDSCFYHNVFDICQSQHLRVPFRSDSNKKSFVIGLFQVCDIKKQQHYILLREMIIFKRELTFLFCVIFSKLLITPASVYRFSYRSQSSDWICKVKTKSLCSLLQRCF